jgi:hypothetical protein
MLSWLCKGVRGWGVFLSVATGIKAMKVAEQHEAECFRAKGEVTFYSARVAARARPGPLAAHSPGRVCNCV